MDNLNKNIYILTHINFWERDLGSRQRLFSLVQYLKKYFNVKVLYILEKKKNDQSKIDLCDLKDNIVFIKEHEAKSSSDMSEINLYLKKHQILKEFFDRDLYSKVSDYIHDNNCEVDALIIEYIHLSYFLPIFKNTKTILDTHDIMNIRNELFKKNNKKHWIDISQEQEFEIFNTFDEVLCIQNKEYEYLVKSNINSVLVPYPVDISKRVPKKTVKNIIFIGGYNEANIDALKWFLDNVWQYFSSFNINLLVYGTVSSAFNSFNYKNVILKGKVEDIRTVYNDADIAINPVKVGGGLKIKNIEALSNSIPLITTTEGANGLESTINKSFLLANTVEEWIDALLYMIISKEIRMLLIKNAIEYSSNKFSEKASYAKLVEYITDRGNNENR